MILALVGLAFAASTPHFPALTQEELADLDEGEVVMRSRSDGPRVAAMGIVRVDAPPEALWPAVLDMQARIPENGTLVGIQEYARESASAWSIQVDMEVLGKDIRIHHLYKWDRPRNVATYTLDPGKPNDLALADGWYLVRATDGGSVLVYEAVTEAKVPVPGWVKNWLARDQMEDLLLGIRRRAERSPRRG